LILTVGLVRPAPRGCGTAAWAGLLTLGSTYSPRLPLPMIQDSGLLRLSSPITAAGPLPILTGFPIVPKGDTQAVWAFLTSGGRRKSRPKLSDPSFPPPRLAGWGYFVPAAPNAGCEQRGRHLGALSPPLAKGELGGFSRGYLPNPPSPPFCERGVVWSYVSAKALDRRGHDRRGRVMPGVIDPVVW
jgi:hypothetical protein